MILLRILDHDLHRSKQGASAIPYMVEIPALPGFVPAIISNTHAKFVIARKLYEGNKIRVGVFDYDSEKLDDLILDMFSAAYELSRDEKWPNVFTGGGAPARAVKYVGEQSGMGVAQPHVCLVPQIWSSTKLNKFFGKEFDGKKYKKYCRIVSAKVAFPVFCSRPDMVGMYTQFLGGGAGFLLHNVKSGLAFCAPTKGS